ncbi:MAG TPA: DUF1329 domain-containing protein [Myxococcota bacterium]|nr:DUF1329 domain-containing protein [Myxococcota bacterium]
MTPLSRLSALALACALAAPAHAHLLDVPPEGSCSPRPLQWTNDAVPAPTDVVPPAFRPGEVLQIQDLARLQGWLPNEVWDRRAQFFFEGMQLEVGPCYRRFPQPAYFDRATAANAGKASLDADGNLAGFSGAGLPFPLDGFDESAPDAAMRLAWDHRYRYQAAGFRGDFRITQVTKGGRSVEDYAGTFFFFPLHGVPGGDEGDGRERFAAGGSFQSPETARGLAWRQYQLKAAETDYKESDDVFVYLPDERKVKRAPPQEAEGVYVPSFTRARSVGNVGMSLPTAGVNDLGNPAIAATEPLRKGFVGLVIRPNAYQWTIGGARDVLAPANVHASGYPPEPSRNFGPSGLSLASDVWDVRRAVELDGVRKSPEGVVAKVAIWIDALTLQPLYWISRESNGAVYEVGIFASRWSADDARTARWQGSGDGFGVMLPVAQSFTVAGEGGGWRREAFVLASEPPAPEQAKDFLSVQGLQRKGH